MSVLRCFVVALLVVAGWPAVAAAQQTFTLTVPFRPNTAAGPQPQIARVKVAFDSAAIGPAPQVAIDGGAGVSPATTCVANAATCNAAGVFGAGDLVAVKWVSATRLEMLLQFNSEFAPNFCTSTRVADRSVSVSITTVAATGYRMASYSVPELVTPTNPAPKCDAAIRRVSANKAFMTQNSGGAATPNGRLPLDVILVLDKSGSMGWALPDGPAGETRFQRLTSAIGQFMGVWKQAVAAGVEGSADDRIGLVFFDSTAQDGILEGASIFKKRGALLTGWDDAGVGDIISAHLLPPAPQVTPGGATSIGGGIALARQRWDALAAGGDQNDSVFVVFTDGEQNTAPCIVGAGEADSPGCATALPAPLQLSGVRLMDFPGPILTIGLGVGGTTFAAMLEQIAHETAGRASIAATGPPLEIGFVDQLVGALKGNTLSLMARKMEPLSTTAAGTLQPFADASVRRLIFVLGWEGMRSPRALSLQLRNPNGMVVPPVASVERDTFMVVAVDTPSGSPVGQWEASVTRLAAKDGQVPIRYHLSAYAVEGALDYHLSVQPAPAGTGLPVKIRSIVAFNGRPIANLPGGALRVRPARPGENLGNILSASPTTGTPQNDGPQTQSPVTAKVDALGQGLLKQIEPEEVGTLTMADRGQGLYEAEFDDTTVGGGYRFVVELNWNDPRTGQIRRVEWLERQVPVRPTEDDSDVQVQRTGTTAQITITPGDPFGNLVGPGWGAMFSVQVTPAATVGAITNPGVRGSYVIPLSGLAPGVDPRVTIRFRGETLRDAPLSQLPRQPRPFSIGIRAGVGVPQGSFSTLFDPGFALDVDVEYAFTSAVAVQGVFGYKRFGTTAGPDEDLIHFGGNVRAYTGPSVARVFATAGLAVYRFDGSVTEPGTNVGGGVQFRVAPRVWVEGVYLFHAVNTSPTNSNFSTFEGGVRVRF
ncbi:MAG: outer membrane beta-barrel protein [Vicinamibacterales bacterium]